MDEDGASGEPAGLPDLRDIEAKIGRKTPEGLVRWMRDEASARKKTDSKLQSTAAAADETITTTMATTSISITTSISTISTTAAAAAQRDAGGRKSLDEKIRKLKTEMALLRSLDVQILQQLLALHEGMEAVRWLAEERGALTSRCSSLTSSQYSSQYSLAGEGPDTSWRGSWSSLHDPSDKLDNISVGSYLDTLADDMDEYGPSGSSESMLCPAVPPAAAAAAPRAPEAAPAGGRAAGGGAPGAAEGAGGGAAGGYVGAGVGSGPATAGVPNGRPVGAGAGSAAEARAEAAAAGAAMGGTRSTAAGKKTGTAGQAKEGPKGEAAVWTKTKEVGKKDPVGKDNGQTRPAKNKGTLETGCDPIQPCLGGKLGKRHSPKFKAYTNGKMDLETCKMNGKMHLEYDAHWRWVQSQDDVTFL
ncbi:Leucine rich adaptor protein 1 [Merluccius polli]|uniref:Leucine rich adaptor protein 1 n=1 Tax=Merluccius polli TaxID=89951 RepID=A0AA47M298_MERPO|nr:Leucine rich adaptor protein 1 [Merluccius polli]